MTLRNKQKGFSLIEVLVGSFVFVVVAVATLKAFGVMMDSVAISRAKVAAAGVANEQIEIIRNLPYQDVGIVAGLPLGKIPRTQSVTRANYKFTVTTTIRSTDDTFDGTIGGSPSDTSPADYKLVDLDIACSNCKSFSPLGFTTLVAPHALETASNNGALFIRVFDSDGLPVPTASIHLVNTQTNPDTVIDDTTDNDGWLKIVDAPTGVEAYNITATKSGYSQDQTYPAGGAAGSNPIQPDATVVVQQVTQTSLSIDRTASLNVSSIDATCASLPSIGFSLTGTKLIGTPNILKYTTHNFSTNSSGSYSISPLEWDTYSVLLTSSSYDLAGTNPLPSFEINPNETKNLQLITIAHVDNALLVSVRDQNDAAIDGATVRLQKSGFDETKTTNSETCPTPGQTFWNGLLSGTYTLTVSKTGYQDSVSNVSISDAWKNQNVILNP